MHGTFQKDIVLNSSIHRKRLTIFHLLLEYSWGLGSGKSSPKFVFVFIQKSYYIRTIEPFIKLVSKQMFLLMKG